MFKLYYRSTGEEVKVLSDKSLTALVYVPNSEGWLYYSPIMDKLIEKYKDVPLTPHVLTDYEKKQIALGPDYAEDVPRFEIKGYDRAIGNTDMDTRLRQEFLTLYKEGSDIAYDFINDCNLAIRAKRVKE